MVQKKARPRSRDRGLCRSGDGDDGERRDRERGPAIPEIVFTRGVRRERHANTRAQPGTFPGTLRRVSRVFAVI